jgi:transcriptional regulator with XRE-family HTH domain
MQEMGQTWRTLLGGIIADQSERQRIAAALGVNIATLIRWAHDETKPRPQNLRTLIKAVPPEYRDQLSELIPLEFPEMAAAGEQAEQDDSTGEIPSKFYESGLTAYINTRKPQRFFTVSNRILKQALSQLDPNLLGMALSIARCMPPSRGQKIRSLREVTGVGTPPWQSTLTQEVLFLGIESLAGYTVMKGRPFAVQNREERLGFLPVRWEEWEESALACPIWFEDRLAGCLLASSSQPGYFLPFRQVLIERYAQFLTLAFDAEDFYEQQDIQLLPMPSRDAQHKQAANFRQRLSEIILQASGNQLAINLEQAERRAWQQLEEELLDLVVPRTEYDSSRG